MIELLIVVSIILVIAAIAVPNYLSAMQRAHEAAAIGYLRHLRAAQETYRMATGEYADTFEKLAPYMAARLAPSEPSEWPSGDVLVAVAIAAPLQGGGPPGGGPPGGTPPGQGGTPPGQGGTPPGQGGTPPGQGGTPPGQGGTPPGQGGTPPGQGGTPPGQAAPPPGGVPAADSIVRSLYIFRLTRAEPLEWSCTAEPVRDRTKNKFFFMDNTGVIRSAIGSLANVTSPQI